MSRRATGSAFRGRDFSAVRAALTTSAGWSARRSMSPAQGAAISVCPVAGGIGWR